MCRNRRRRPGPGSRSAFSPIWKARRIVAVPVTVAPGSLEHLQDLTLALDTRVIDDAKRTLVLHSPEDKILTTVPSKGVLAHLVGHSAFCPGQVRR